MSTVYDELQKLINSVSERKQNDSTNSRVRTLSRAGAVANLMPCPSNCQCPGGCPMDVTESDVEPAGLACDTDANRCPFDGPWCWWPCPPSCQCSGECPMDVTETDEQIGVGTRDVWQFQPNGQQYAWPDNMQNIACHGQNPIDFLAVYGKFIVEAQDVDQFQSTGQQYAWPGNAQNGVCPEQFWTDVMHKEAIVYTGQCPTDFPAVYEQVGVDTQVVGQVSFTGPQYEWPGNTENAVGPEQCPTDFSTVYGQVGLVTYGQVGVETQGVSQFQSTDKYCSCSGNSQNVVCLGQNSTDFPAVYGQVDVGTQGVSQSQATDPQYAWPDNVQNVVSPEQYWTNVMQMEANANTNVYSSTESEVSLFGSCSYSSDEVFQVNEIVRVE